MNKTRLASMILIGAGLCLLWTGQARPQSCTGVLANCKINLNPGSGESCCLLLQTSVAITGNPAPSGCKGSGIPYDSTNPNLQCGYVVSKWPVTGVCNALAPTGETCGGPLYGPLCQ
jgi:hypothetical protein